ncbi:MAG TPA: phosphatase PAP2 family protein [Puia sp.]|nr:phosphatase PAP2 family protein [Puia sp.]
MKILQSPANRNPAYFIGYIFFFIFLSLFCLINSKADGFLLINHFHNEIFDHFFTMFTNVGNGFVVVALMLFLLIRKKTGWVIQIGISLLISGLMVQMIKHFMPSPRPVIFFASGAVHYILGVTRTGRSSFPSGHTATAFMLTTLLALYFPGRKPGLFFLAIAVLTGYSRIYLSQHFPVDVLAGSLAGVLPSLAVYIFIPLPFFEKKFAKSEWDQQSVKLR